MDHYVGRVEQHMDSTTRQRALIVVVDAPLQQETALLAGSLSMRKFGSEPRRTVGVT